MSSYPPLKHKGHFTHGIFKPHWPKCAEKPANFHLTRTCSCKSFPVVSLPHLSPRSSTGCEVETRSLVLLILILVTIGNKTDPSWGLFQGYFLSQFPNEGEKHKEDQLQGVSASAHHVKHPRLYPHPLEGIIHMQINQKDYHTTGLSTQTGQLSQVVKRHLYVFPAF